MKHYRILEIVDTNFCIEYKVQKRFLGFLWWYTPIECTDWRGRYTCHSLLEAKTLLDKLKLFDSKDKPSPVKEKRKVVWEE